MLKVRRSPLDPGLQTDLDRRHTAVTTGQGGKKPWEAFKTYEREEARAKRATVAATLGTMFHEKCAYCERDEATEIDHHWPKAPHKSLNRRRGTPAKMFLWSNLLLACTFCNGFRCKGAHMEWDAQDRAKLLDPSAVGDDPICYFTIQTNPAPRFSKGWMDMRKGLRAEAEERARYTRRRLKLNDREALVRRRAVAIDGFYMALFCLQKGGADGSAPNGLTVRKHFANLFDPKTPHLAPIRQILRENLPIRQELLAAMPELGLLLDQWDLPPDDCAALRAAP